jgi:hypothetical protein
MASTAAEAEQQANGSGEQKTRHSEVGHKSLLKSDDLYQVRGLWTPRVPWIWSDSDWGINFW